MEELHYIIDEKNKLLLLSEHNTKTIDKFKKIISIIDQLEAELILKSKMSINEIVEIENSIQENIELLRTISIHLIKS